MDTFDNWIFQTDEEITEQFKTIEVFQNGFKTFVAGPQTEKQCWRVIEFQNFPAHTIDSFVVKDYPPKPYTMKDRVLDAWLDAIDQQTAYLQKWQEGRVEKMVIPA